MWRTKGYPHLKIDSIMGERNCAIEGCNALEFRDSGYCLRHEDDHPWLTQSEVSLDPVLRTVAPSKEEWKEREGGFLKSPLGWAIALTAWFFPPILLLLIPIYMFNRPTSKEDEEPGSGEPDANSCRDEDAVGGNSGDSQLPWWVLDEGAQG